LLRVRLRPNAIAGQRGLAGVIVTNAGPGAAIGNVDITLAVSPDGTSDHAVTIGTITGGAVRLGAHGRRGFLMPFTLPEDLSSGNYTFLATIDTANAFTEADESNNTAVGPVAAVAAQVHDVAATSLFTRPTLRAGQFGGVLVFVQNTGNVIENGVVSVTLTATAAGGAPITILNLTPHVILLPQLRRPMLLRFVVPKELIGDVTLAVTVQPITFADNDPTDNAATRPVAVT
jgi:hypothetical protein